MFNQENITYQTLHHWKFKYVICKMLAQTAPYGKLTIPLINIFLIFSCSFVLSSSSLESLFSSSPHFVNLVLSVKSS